MTRHIKLLTPEPDVLALTETYLHPGLLNSELGLHNYNIIRKDRHNHPNAPSGGGVLFAVKEGIKTRLLETDSSIEQIFIEVLGPHKKLILGVFYPSPRSDTNDYSKHVCSVEKLRDDFGEHDFVILGDYNLPKTTWTNADSSQDFLFAHYYGTDALIKDNSDVIMNGFSYLGFNQFYPIHLNKGYTLDLAFTSLNEDQFYHIPSKDSLVPPETCHHDPAFFGVKCENLKCIGSVLNSRDFYHADYDEINLRLSRTDWEKLFEGMSLDDNIDGFYSVLNEIITELVPIKNYKSSSYPKWFSPELITNIINKKKFHKKWLQFNIIDDYIEFKKLRAMCIRMSRRDRQKYISEVENNSSRNIKHFWSYVNNLSKSNHFPDEMFLYDSKETTTKGICNLFAKNFDSVYSNNNNVFHHEIYTDNEIDILISQDEISKAIGKLKNKASLGPDGLPALFVKNCSKSILRPLAILLNKSLSCGKMPAIWKKSFITPIFKAGNVHDILNYRPISIMGSVAKIFDSIMTEKLTSMYVKFIIKEQHGFVKGRSTLTNLILYSDYISNALSKYKQVDSIYLDFCKAFDSVNHSILIYKLHKFGINGSLLRWIESYLSNRELQVRIKGHVSDPFTAKSGVPQGSNLGPLLFILFINDAADSLKNAQILIFADDIKLFSVINSIHDQVLLQKDLDLIINWSKLNKLKLNVEKCKLLSFGRSRVNSYSFQYKILDQDLNSVSFMKDLGIIFESSFKFDMHIDTVTTKAFKLLGFIKRSTKEFKNINSIINLYNALIKPILLYGSLIWSPHYDVGINKLEAVRHKFIRYIAYKQGTPMNFDEHDYSLNSRLFNLGAIKSAHIYNDLCFVKKLKLAQIHCSDITNLFEARSVPYDLRNPRDLIEQTAFRTYVHYATVNRLRRKWNKLPSNIRFINTLSHFKVCLKKYVTRYK